jgi:catechol 2,3-dioxygenase-like lactoylglutathione lyase family enzyme
VRREAHPVMLAAYRAGVPSNGKPFPDGSKIAKIERKPKKSTEASFDVNIPASQQDVFSSRRTARDSKLRKVGHTPSLTTTRRPACSHLNRTVPRAPPEPHCPTYSGERGNTISELESSMNQVQIEQKSYEMPPRDGITVAHFLTVADIDRSLRFYETVFGGRALSRGDSKGAPGYIQIANTWLLVNVGGGPMSTRASACMTRSVKICGLGDMRASHKAIRRHTLAIGRELEAQRLDAADGQGVRPPETAKSLVVGIDDNYVKHREQLIARQFQVTAGRVERNAKLGARFVFVSSNPGWTANFFDGFLLQQGMKRNTVMRVVTDAKSVGTMYAVTAGASQTLQNNGRRGIASQRCTSNPL